MARLVRPAKIPLITDSSTRFGLSLPAGDNQLIVFADLNRNGMFGQDEMVDESNVALDPNKFSDKSLTQFLDHLRLSSTVCSCLEMS